MGKDVFRKGMVLGIIVLFLGASVVPSISGAILGFDSVESNKTMSTLQRGTLYVGGGGPNNYTKIQDAIDDAEDGDTVFVYNDSSPYYENVAVNKSITLIGEDMNTTVIDGSGSYSIIHVLVEGIEINNFTVQNGRLGINSSYGVIIKSVIVKENEYGIFFRDIPESSTTKIMFSIITQNDYGIHLATTCNIYIYGNRVDDNNIAGIFITTSCENNEIAYNNITNNRYGIWLRFGSKNNSIHHNNFIDNSENHVWVQNCLNNNWINNYWDNWIGLKSPLLKWIPKIIWAWYGPLPLFQFDFFPWIEPIKGPCP